MRYADTSPRHKQIVDVARVETAIGNWVTILAINATIMYCDRDEWIVWVFDRILVLGIVQIDRPGAWDAAIGKFLLLDDVILRQH